MNKIEQNIKTGFVPDTKYSYVIEDLREMEPAEYNEENFYTKPDDIRFFTYLSRTILSKTEKRDLSDHIDQRKIYKRPFMAGTIITDDRVLSIVPELDSLRDEMSCIHEYTHLLNYLNNPSNQDSIYKNVIPTFNEYDYLKQIDKFYSDYYRRLVFNNAIEAAKNMNQKNQKDCLSYIIAYLVLEHRKDKYDIDKLNKINCNSKKLEKSLIDKGYTF